MAELEKLGGPEALAERFQELLDEQRERHEGGNKWIGTGGKSPFGAYGFNPEGYRIGQDSGNATAARSKSGTSGATATCATMWSSTPAA